MGELDGGGWAQVSTEDQEFGERLRRLAVVRAERLDGQPSGRALARTVGVSATTLGSWLRGDRLPKDVEQLVKLVEQIRSAARVRGVLDDALAGELDGVSWRAAYQAAARRVADRVAVGASAAIGRSVLVDDRPGLPIERYREDPLLLEVHRAIAVQAAEEDLGALPVYVSRPHDARLQAIVDDVAAGATRLVVLVGGPAVGKTRACWEAASRLAGDWRIWHPLSPGRVEALLDGVARVGPQTVVWLNEAQHYLLAAAGETVAAHLRELLGDRSRSPVLILATIWPEYWRTLTAVPPDGAPDPHSQARQLLSGNSIEVPDAFGQEALDGLRALSERDARLAEAARDAASGQITQYLAGIPALVERYTTATPAAKALVHAAMDLKRLSGSDLLLEFLANAAPGYLSDEQWNDTDDDRWLENGLQAMAAPCKGVLGPLTRIRARVRREGPLMYRLADYLERLGRTEREQELPPETFWSAAAVYLPVADLPDLAWQASSRGMYRIAAAMLKDSLRGSCDAGAADLLRLVEVVDPRSLTATVDWVLSTVQVIGLNVATSIVGTLLDHGLVEPAKRIRQRAAETAPLLRPQEVDNFLVSPTSSGGHSLGDGWDDRAIMAALLARSPAADVVITDLRTCVGLLRRFAAIGATDQFEQLASRLAEEADDSWIVPLLRESGAEKQAADASARLSRLAGDAVDSVDVAHREIVNLLRDLETIGAVDVIDRLLLRDLAGQADLHNANDLAMLISAFAHVRASEQIARLMGRIRTHAPSAPPQWTADLYGMAVELRFDRDIVSQLPIPDFVALFRLDIHWGLIVRALALRSSADALDELVDRVTTAVPEAHQEPELLAVLDALADLDPARLARPLAALLAAPLTNPTVVAWLLNKVADGNDNDSGPVADLLAREPMATIALTDPEGLVSLMETLDGLDRHDQITELLDRDLLANVELTSPAAVAEMLEITAHFASPSQRTALATRASHEASPTDVIGAGRLLRCMLTISAHEPANRFARRVVRHTDRWPVTELDDFLDVLQHSALADVRSQLMTRDVAGLIALDGSRADRSRAPMLLNALKVAGADEQVRALARKLVSEVDPDRAGTSWEWAMAMRDVGAEESAQALARRMADTGHFDVYLRINPTQAETFAHGREPDRRPTRPWTWADLS